MTTFEAGKEPSPENRRGDWMQTFSGGQFWPLDPRPSDIHLVDIANALARICRFGGHVTVPHYSVAQHSVLVVSIVDRQRSVTPSALRRAALLHDAAEAYVGDVIRPLKHGGGPFDTDEMKMAEKRIEWAIGERFGVDLVNLPQSVKDADNIALATERRDVMAPGPYWGGLPLQPQPERIACGLGAEQALEVFMAMARELGLERA